LRRRRRERREKRGRIYILEKLDEKGTDSHFPQRETKSVRVIGGEAMRGLDPEIT
jgi:hypothetical protein